LCAALKVIAAIAASSRIQRLRCGGNAIGMRDGPAVHVIGEI
jgi:hypothetical protein